MLEKISRLKFEKKLRLKTHKKLIMLPKHCKSNSHSLFLLSKGKLYLLSWMLDELLSSLNNNPLSTSKSYTIIGIRQYMDKPTVEMHATTIVMHLCIFREFRSDGKVFFYYFHHLWIYQVIGRQVINVKLSMFNQHKSRLVNIYLFLQLVFNQFDIFPLIRSPIQEHIQNNGNIKSQQCMFNVMPLRGDTTVRS